MEQPALKFHEDVWDPILSQLEDSKDIVNFFKAYPWMSDLVLKNKYWWLIDQVIPFIVRWLNLKDILACRQVCKRWNQAIDNFLENHPDQRAFDHDVKTTGQIWIPEASPAKYKLRDLFPGLKQLRSSSLLAKFLEDMEEHPRCRSPFVGRAVTLSFPGPEQLPEYLNKAMQLLKKFGHHIWFLEILWGEEVALNDDPIHFAHQVIQFLFCVPDLKSISLCGTIPFINEHSGMATALVDSLQSFPELPYLETLLDISEDLPFCLKHYFGTRYSNQIRRLDCSCRFWWTEYGNNFSNLTELRLPFVVLIEDARVIFNNASSLPLRSLTLPSLRLFDGDEFGYYDSDDETKTEPDPINLVEVLSRFQQLYHVTLEDLEGYVFEEAGQQFTISSIESFELDGGRMKKFSFSPLLQSLKHLKLVLHDEPDELRKQMYDPRLWEGALPKLKTVTLERHWFTICALMHGNRWPPVVGDRATFEYLKANGKLEVCNVST